MAAIGYGLRVQQGINLLQVGALRLPCLIASVGSVMRVAEIALRGISEALKFFGFNSNSTFATWVSKAVDYVRPYKDNHTTTQLVKEALVLAAIGIAGNAVVSALFGPAPAVYNNVLQWVGPIRVSSDNHPLIDMAANAIARI